MRKWGLIVLAVAVYAAERGLDVSGIEYFPLSIGLWSLAGGLGLVGLGLFVWPHLRRKDKSKVVGADVYAGYFYLAGVRADAGHQIVAKVGDYTSPTVTTNGAGYYRELHVEPPNAEYIGFPVEFYVDGEKVSHTGSYGGGGHRSNQWTLEREEGRQNLISFTVSPSVPSADKGYRAVLRIDTDQEVEFEAVAEVLEGHPGHDQYQMFWEGRRTAARKILPGAPATILVAEIVRRSIDIWRFDMFRFDGDHWGLFGKRAWDRRDEIPLVPDPISLHVKIAAGSSAFKQDYRIEFGDGGRTMTFTEAPSGRGDC